ncbi:MAG TPA: hypothetical protein VGE39_21845 [Prosthecobacter sp.]
MMKHFLLLLIALLFSSAAHAQYVTNLTLAKESFLTGEPVVATVTIINRSGADAIVGGKGSRDWLQFEITESTGRQLAPITIGSEGALTLKAGGTTKHTVELSGGYSTSSLGTFHMVANVLHPITGQFYQSNRARLMITDSKPNLFDQPYGVPQGFPGAGRARRFQVILYRELNNLQLYVRITDDRSGTYIATFLLGPVLMVAQPQVVIDAKNNLNIFFLARPQVFCHAVVSPDGTLKHRSYYKDVEGNRPSLVVTPAGGQVIGGQPFDPGAPPPAKKMRKASERPAGL